MSADGQTPKVVPPSRRRDKPILSCTLCRRRKLKCDRQQPCKTCVDRGLSLSCAYVRSTPATKEPKIPNSVHERINQLEKLVTNLIGGNTTDLADLALPIPAQVQHHDPDNDATLPGTPDRVIISGDATSYTNSGHWTSILDSISELREHLDQIPSPSNHEDDVPDDVPGPELLFGRYPHATKEELLAALPPRPEADQIISTFFESMETHPILMHKPTFLKKYDEFWAQPLETSTMWLGQLYAALALGFRFQAAMGARQPGDSDLATDPVRINFYREKAVQCMILADYTKTPPYTIEAFLLYFGTEFVRSADSQFSIYMLVGMMVRLCFRMGYHRDPSRFPNISPYRGELRRRKWLVIMSLDLITSSQVGLPRMIMPSMYDTQEPRNLDEDDLHEDILDLPPSRPETELTQLLYSIILTRVRNVQARIVDLVNATSQPPYGEITEIDTALRRVFEKIPQSSAANTVEDFNAALSLASMRYLHLDMAFLKAELMLHRPYLVLGRTDNKYAYSRRVCLNASIEMLRFQSRLDAEVQPGGGLCSPGWHLSTVSWYMSSIVAQDFLLATTVLLLELEEDLIAPVSPSSEITGSGMRLDHAPPTREEIVASLRSACRIWTRASKRSQEARKVATAVKLVLSKVHDTGVQVADSAQTTLPTAQFDLTSPSQSFDFNDPRSAVPGSDPFGICNGAFGHPFDFGYMPMDLDHHTLPFDWVDAFPNRQPQPFEGYPPGSLFQ